MTAFFLLFIVGAVLAFIGKLGGEYVALAGTLHAFVIARAISEDKYICGGQCKSDHANDDETATPAAAPAGGD